MIITENYLLSENHLLRSCHGGRFKWVKSEPFGKLVTFDDDYHPDYPPVVMGMSHVDDYLKRNSQRKQLQTPDPKSGRFAICVPKIKPARRHLLAIDPYCHYCRCELNEEDSTLDHKQPKSKGGSNERNNLVLACRECNNRKADLTYEEFLDGCGSIEEVD